MVFDIPYSIDQPSQPVATLIFAHGAGAPMDSEFINRFTDELKQAGICVVRFEFPYMQQRRLDGKKRPPNRQPILLEYFEQVVRDIAGRKNFTKPLLIGGKSMGGRMASLLAATRDVPLDGVCCVGFPFHPPGKREKLKVRTEHLQTVTTPVHIFQGTRDPFGKKDDISTLHTSPSVTVHWLEDGDHDLKTRKVSSFSQEQHLQEVAHQISALARGLS